MLSQLLGHEKEAKEKLFILILILDSVFWVRITIADRTRGLKPILFAYFKYVVAFIHLNPDCRVIPKRPVINT